LVWGIKVYVNVSLNLLLFIANFLLSILINCFDCTTIVIKLIKKKGDRRGKALKPNKTLKNLLP